MAPLASRAGQVLEVGCGNGASTRLILQNVAPDSLTGVDPSRGLIERARRTYNGNDAVSFDIGDAVFKGQPDAAFDLVFAHTVFSHLADPKSALAKAFSVLMPGGRIAIFDGDCAANTVTLFDGDPLQAAMRATQRNLIHDPYILRHLPKQVAQAGFIDADLLCLFGWPLA